jgi:hypothetical protein
MGLITIAALRLDVGRCQFEKHRPPAYMNTGMQDAFNLGWKLALAVQGRVGEHLLNSYQAERHPVGVKVVEFRDRAAPVPGYDAVIADPGGSLARALLDWEPCGWCPCCRRRPRSSTPSAWVTNSSG